MSFYWYDLNFNKTPEEKSRWEIHREAILNKSWKQMEAENP